ncbi:hypothetical protein GEMRC1_014142 [Eukaryota sp. GEM-RC1]
MPEALLLCIDNSEYLRNGDLPPNRMKAQTTAAGNIARSIINSNHENGVGVMVLGTEKNSSSVIYPIGRDLSRIYRELDRVSFCDQIDFLTALENSILVLKNRPYPNQSQRIVAFVSSPLRVTSEQLIKMGKKLRKHNIAVDVVNVAEPTNTDLLQEFINTTNADDNSHLVTVPSGPHQLTDLLTNSPILGGGGAPMEEDMDEELRAVLEMSRREAEQAEISQQGVPMEEEQSVERPPSVGASRTPAATDSVVLDVVNRLRRGEDVPFDSLTDDQQTQVAILLSMEEQEEEEAPSPTLNVDESYLLGDRSAVEELMGSVPGVDMSNPEVLQALQQTEEDRKKKEDEEEEKE